MERNFHISPLNPHVTQQSSTYWPLAVKISFWNQYPDESLSNDGNFCFLMFYPGPFTSMEWVVLLIFLHRWLQCFPRLDWWSAKLGWQKRQTHLTETKYPRVCSVPVSLGILTHPSEQQSQIYLSTGTTLVVVWNNLYGGGNSNTVFPQLEASLAVLRWHKTPTSPRLNPPLDSPFIG